jgi:membrane protein DedA with SNARE-associated domain
MNIFVPFAVTLAAAMVGFHAGYKIGRLRERPLLSPEETKRLIEETVREIREGEKNA